MGTPRKRQSPKRAATDWFRYPDETEGPWLVALHFDVLGGRAEVVGVEMWAREPGEGDRRPPLMGAQGHPGAAPGDFFAAPGEESAPPWVPGPPRPITSSAIRLPLDLLVQQRRPALARMAEEVSELDTGQLSAAQKRYGAEVAQALAANRPKRGHPLVRGPDHYREVAEIYAEAHLRNEPPTKAVKDHFQVAAGTAAAWVSTARKRGYLDQTEPGKAGGVPVQPRRVPKPRSRISPVKQALAAHQAVERRLWDQKNREEG